MMDWDDLRFFLAVHRTGSLSAAARLLRVDQTTAGRRIAALEERLTVRLFERLPSGLVPTDSAEALVASAERMEAEAAAAERAIAGRDAQLSGSVRVTAIESFGSAFLAPRLAAFQLEHPAITVELVTDTRSLNLVQREADIAVRLARPTQEGLVVRKAAELGFGLYAARPALKSTTWLGFDASLSHLPEAVWTEKQRKGAAYAFRSNSTLALLEATRAGLGRCVLPCYLADSDRSLRKMQGPDDVLRRTLWLAVHADLRTSARVRLVLDFLAQTFERDAKTLAG